MSRSRQDSSLGWSESTGRTEKEPSKSSLKRTWRKRLKRIYTRDFQVWALLQSEVTLLRKAPEETLHTDL